MSMTKRWMDKDAEKKRRDEKATCDCYWNWDDKFEVLCPKHEAEEREARQEMDFEYQNEFQRR